MNPQITKYYGDLKIVRTNCGSLTLPESVAVARHTRIDITYVSPYGLGERISWNNIGPVPGFTIQHEVEHTQGRLLV